MLKEQMLQVNAKELALFGICAILLVAILVSELVGSD